MAALLGARAYRYTDRYQDQQWASLSLQQLQTQLKAHQDEPLFLYHYGKRLNQTEHFKEAQAVLERAGERLPDSARIRDEWAKALLAQGNLTAAFNILTQYTRIYPQVAEGHLSLARFYVSQNAMRRGGEELELALRLNPELGEAWYYLAVVRDHGGDQAAALTAIRKAVALRPESAPDFALLGELLRNANDLAGARSAYQRAVSLDPKKARYHFSLGSLLLTTQELAAAEKEAQLGIQVDPEEADCHLLLGKVRQAQGRDKEAIAPLERAASLVPLAPAPADLLRKAHRALGNAVQEKRWAEQYLLRRREADAYQQAEEAVRRNPEAPEAQRQLARLMARRGDIEGTLRHLSVALKTTPDAPIVLIETGRTLISEKQAALALPILRDALQQAQRSPAGMEAMGDALLALNRPREASIYYQTVGEWKPSLLPLFEQRIQACYARRSNPLTEAERAYQQALQLKRSRLGPALTTDEVVTLLQKATTLAPEVTDYRRALVRAYVERRENDKAIATARKLWALSPEDTMNRALLAVALLESSGTEAEFAEIFAHLNAAWPDPSARPMVHYGRGLLALRRNKAVEAVSELKKAVELDPDAEPTWYQLSRAYQQLGDPAKAQESLALFKKKQAEKQEEVALLGAIAEQPNRRELYDKAITFYEKRQGYAQANAIRAERKRRFKTL